MKTLKSFLMLLLLVPFFGCDLVDDLTEREIDIPITAFVNIQVAVPFDSDPVTPFMFPFSSSSSYSLLEDPVVTNAIDNPDDIVRLRINLVRYEYRDFTGEYEVLASGDIQIANLGAVYTYSTKQTHVAEADMVNTRITLEGNYASVDNFLDRNKEFAVVYKGFTNANPAQFNTYITIDAVVTVKVSADDL